MLWKQFLNTYERVKQWFFKPTTHSFWVLHEQWCRNGVARFEWQYVETTGNEVSALVSVPWTLGNLPVRGPDYAQFVDEENIWIAAKKRETCALIYIDWWIKENS